MTDCSWHTAAFWAGTAKGPFANPPFFLLAAFGEGWELRLLPLADTRRATLSGGYILEVVGEGQLVGKRSFPESRQSQTSPRTPRYGTVTSHWPGNHPELPLFHNATADPILLVTHVLALRHISELTSHSATQPD